jgi:hypothetical protein
MVSGMRETITFDWTALRKMPSFSTVETQVVFPASLAFLQGYRWSGARAKAVARIGARLIWAAWGVYFAILGLAWERDLCMELGCKHRGKSSSWVLWENGSLGRSGSGGKSIARSRNGNLVSEAVDFCLEFQILGLEVIHFPMKFCDLTLVGLDFPHIRKLCYSFHQPLKAVIMVVKSPLDPDNNIISERVVA